MWRFLWALITWKVFLTSLSSFTTFKFPSFENDFRQWSHGKYFSLIWVLYLLTFWKWILTLITWKRFLLCVFKSIFCENVFGHWSHRKSFSSVWDLVCFFKSQLFENFFENWSHGNCFSPVCFLCNFKFPSFENDFLTLITWKMFFSMGSYMFLEFTILWK